MTVLDYPVVYECAACGQALTVTREDARQVSPTLDALDALDRALEERGWVRGEVEARPFCPNCVNTRAQ